MNTSRQNSRSLLLDLLRIFAALWVVSFHWVGRGGFSPGLNSEIDFSFWPHLVNSLSSPGFLGVDIFFILSGTVIGKSAIQKTWQSFSQNRFLRLFPVYIAASVIAIAVVPLVDSDWKRSDAIASLSGLQFWIGGPTIIGAAWTLAIEIQFYAIVAIFILMNKTLNSEKIRQLAFVIIAFSIVANLVNFGPVTFIAILPWGGYFALGMLLSTTTNFQELKSNSFPLIVAMVLSGNTLYNRLSAMYPEASPAYRLGIPLAVLVGVTSLILMSNMLPAPQSYSVEWKGIATLSLMTYPIYLFHETVGISGVAILSSTGLNIRICFLIVAAIVMLISWVSVRWFEPFARNTLRAFFSWTKATY